jgi:hypothetical protein
MSQSNMESIYSEVADNLFVEIDGIDSDAKPHIIEILRERFGPLLEAGVTLAEELEDESVSAMTSHSKSPSHRKLKAPINRLLALKDRLR